MRKEFSDELEAKEFAQKVKGNCNYFSWREDNQWVVTWEESKFDLRPFIKHCLSDDEFWMHGGIPTKEEYYIKKLGMTKEQEHEFYKAMCSLQQLAKELKGFIGRRHDTV